MIGKIAVTLLFILLIWGNLVAGLKAGLACPDWPLCYGSVLPPFRWDIYMEFMHRVIGAVASIAMIILAYKRVRTYVGAVKLVPIITVALLLLQIVVGGMVVLYEIPVDLTTFHFGNAMVIYGLVLYLAYFDGDEAMPVFNVSGFPAWFFFLSILVFFQTVLGAFVRHSHAGLACPDFPTCLGSWVPPDLTGIILYHFSHRITAYLITIIALVLFVVAYTKEELNRFRPPTLLLLGLIIIQIALGVGVVLMKLQFAITAIHLSVALLILSLCLLVWFRGMWKSSI